MNEDLLRFKKNQKYLVFDYETCNLNLNKCLNKPWQLGFLVADYNKIYEKHELYIEWENLQVSKDAQKITGFSKSKYNKLKKPSEYCLELFEKYLYNDDYIIIGQNILGFDVYIHNIHRLLCNKVSNYSYLNRLYDTNCLSRIIKNEIAIPKDLDLISFQYKLLNLRTKGVRTTLKEMCKYFKIDFDESKLHDALYDVEKTYEVFKNILWQIEI